MASSTGETEHLHIDEKEHRILSQIRISGFESGVDTVNRVKIAKSTLEPLFKDLDPLTIQPRNVVAYGGSSRDAILIFRNKEQADQFFEQAIPKVQLKPLEYEGRRLYFNKMKVGDDYILHKAVGRAVSALRDTLQIKPEDADKKETAGNRSNGIIWKGGKQVANIFMEEGLPVLKVDRDICTEQMVDAAALKAKYNAACEREATRWS